MGSGPGGLLRVGYRTDATTNSTALLDVSSQPPVTRTFRKSDITAVAPADAAGFFNHAVLPYRKRELLDVAAFLGKPEPQKKAAAPK